MITTINFIFIYTWFLTIIYILLLYIFSPHPPPFLGAFSDSFISSRALNNRSSAVMDSFESLWIFDLHTWPRRRPHTEGFLRILIPIHQDSTQLVLFIYLFSYFFFLFLLLLLLLFFFFFPLSIVGCSVFYGLWWRETTLWALSSIYHGSLRFFYVLHGCQLAVGFVAGFSLEEMDHRLSWPRSDAIIHPSVRFSVVSNGCFESPHCLIYFYISILFVTGSFFFFFFFFFSFFSFFSVSFLLDSSSVSFFLSILCAVELTGVNRKFETRTRGAWRFRVGWFSLKSAAYGLNDGQSETGTLLKEVWAVFTCPDWSDCVVLFQLICSIKVGTCVGCWHRGCLILKIDFLKNKMDQFIYKEYDV